MAKKLIINADDYGRTAAISTGIRESHLKGLVSTSTVMMNFSTAIDDIGLAHTECPKLGLGVHLTLTAGRPVLPAAQVPSLVNNDGTFFKLNQLTSAYSQVNPAELRAEWQAQIEKFLATGTALDHLDSHHHSSYFTETAFGLMLDLANEYGTSVRRPRPMNEMVGNTEFVERLLAEKRTRCPDHFVTTFYDVGATLANLLDIFNALPMGLTEVMSHPGYLDEEILRDSAYNRQRETELAILTSPEARSALESGHIQLTTFTAAL